MPFTFAHPAAVLPLRRSRWLVFSALVVGSMAPDFEYFFGLARPVSHSFPGVITFTFPVAVAVLVIFHALMKWPLISLLPRGLQARVVEPARGFRWLPLARLILIILSVAAGIATHLVWDLFSHPDNWATAHFPLLMRTIHVLPHHKMPIHLAMEYGGTLFGVFAVAIAFVRWYRRAPRHYELLTAQLPVTVKWSILSTITITTAILAGLNGTEWYGFLLRDSSYPVRVVLGFSIAAIAVGAVELLGFSLIWRAFLARTLVRNGASAAD